MTQILQPPELAIDKYMAERFGHKMIPRGKIERRVVWNLLSQLEAAGFTDWEVMNEDEEDDDKCATIKDVMELVFNLDEARIYCTGKTGKRHWLFIVLGNDGWDSLADYGYPENDVDGFRAVCDSFDGEDYV